MDKPDLFNQTKPITTTPIITSSSYALPDKRWSHISETYDKGLQVIEDRRDGKILSVRTPWSGFNEFTMNGLDWHSVTVLGARPGGGKTAMVNQITNQCFDLNLNQNIAVLNFQWEMLPHTTAIREATGIFKNKTMHDINSAYNKLPQDDVDKIRNYFNTKRHLPIFAVGSAKTVNGFKKTVRDFHAAYPKFKIIVTIDHSYLFKKDATEKDKFEMLYNVGDALNELKQELPALFIILSQLNRNSEAIERQKEGTHGNYLMSSDLFGADALTQMADTIVMINRPARFNWRYYGPEKFLVDPNLIALHFTKARSNTEGMMFLKAAFERMMFDEYPNNNGRPMTKAEYEDSQLKGMALPKGNFQKI